jgi:hypothetical protein
MQSHANEKGPPKWVNEIASSDLPFQFLNESSIMGMSLWKRLAD